MAQTISEYQGLLVIERCWCGIQHAVPESLVNFQKRQFEQGKPQQSIFCPLGHGWIRTGKTEAERLKAQLKRSDELLAQSIASHDQTRAELRETNRRRIAQKGVTTKLKKRIAAGMCPCCQRPFANLMRHMQHQHPDFTAVEVE